MSLPTETETNDTTALLVRARGFIERGWCRAWFARDIHGNESSPCSEHAVAWCMTGALIAADDGIEGANAAATKRLSAAIGGDGLIGVFNDTQETVEPVLAAFDRAIAASREE